MIMLVRLGSPCRSCRRSKHQRTGGQTQRLLATAGPGRPSPPAPLGARHQQARGKRLSAPLVAPLRPSCWAFAGIQENSSDHARSRRLKEEQRQRHCRQHAPQRARRTGHGRAGPLHRAFSDARGGGGGAGDALSAAGSCGGAAGLDEAHPVAAAALGPHELDMRGVSRAEALEAARRRHCGPGRRVRPVQHLRRTRKGGHLLGCLRAAADTSETRGTRKSITLLARRSVKDPTPGRWAPATRPPRRRMRHSDQSGSRVGRVGARRRRQVAEREQARE